LAKLIAIWPCHRSWERIAIISTAQHAEQLSQEVFRCAHIEDAVAAATRFFAVMPKLAEAPAREIIPPRAKDRWFPTTAGPNLPQAAISPSRGAPPAKPATSPPAQVPNTAPPHPASSGMPPGIRSVSSIPIPVSAATPPPRDTWETHAIPR
jgi:hypothetical protein